MTKVTFVTYVILTVPHATPILLGNPGVRFYVRAIKGLFVIGFGAQDNLVSVVV